MANRITEKEIDDVKKAARDKFDDAWVELGVIATAPNIDPETGDILDPAKKTEFISNTLSPAVTNLAHTIIDAAIKTILDQINIEFPSD